MMSTATQTHEPAANAKPDVYGPPVTAEVMVKVQAMAFLEGDGRGSVIVPELPGCVTQGDTMEEVHEMVKKAAEGWLAAILGDAWKPREASGRSLWQGPTSTMALNPAGGDWWRQHWRHGRSNSPAQSPR